MNGIYYNNKLLCRLFLEKIEKKKKMKKNFKNNNLKKNV